MQALPWVRGPTNLIPLTRSAKPFGTPDVALRALCMGRSKVPVWEKTADTLGMKGAELRLEIPLGNPTLGVLTPFIPRDASGLSRQTQSVTPHCGTSRENRFSGGSFKPPRAPPTPGGQGMIEWDPHW